MTGPDEDVVYGLMVLAGVDVALPLAALREVVPCPPELAGLPVSSVGLLGAMSLRSLVLPVVDVRQLVGRPAERSDTQVVVVVSSGGQVLGLLADEVRGITQVPPSSLMAMTADGGELLFSHTFRHPVTGSVVSVLDAAAVLRRPGVPTVADASGGTAITDAAGGLARRTGSGRRVALLRCGAHRLALDVEQVHTTLASPAPRPSPLSGGLCRGVTEFAGREVAVVDPLALLGLGRLAPEDAGAGLVLDLGHGYVVLALTSLLDLTELAAEDVLALPAFAVRRPDLLAGIAQVDGTGECLVLDGPALLADPDLVSLASVNTALDRDAAEGDPVTGDGAEVAGPARSYLTYTAGVDVATPLEQVAEILPVPASLTATDVGDGLLGVVVHRRAAVPVMCLSTLLGRPGRPVSEASCLLLVRADGAHLAFAVDGLRGIDALTWSDPDQPTDRQPADATRVLRSAPLVRIGAEARLLPDLDLQGLARRVLRPPAAEGSPLPEVVEDAVPVLVPAGGGAPA